MFDNKLLFSELSIGDLVSLKEDVLLKIGYGLIIDIKYDFDDVYDLLELKNKISNIENVTSRTDDFYPTKPHILVLWSKTNKGVSLWMYDSELTLIEKVAK